MDEGLELGLERAKMLRLMRDLRRLRNVSQDQILTAIMASETYRRVGKPTLQYMTLDQARAIVSMLEHWCEQAGTAPAKLVRTPSKAPRAPWDGAKGDNGTTEA